MKNIITSLNELNISVTGIDKLLLKNELIVEDLIVLAEFAVFPIDDLACARVLKSPIIGITEQELMDICINRNQKSLWHSVLENNELCNKYQLKKLESYVKNSSTLSAYNFFMHVLTDGGKERFISRLGVECLEVLYEFLDVVLIYSNEYTASLSDFLEWFHSFEHELKREPISHSDAVRLMTVHGSKGLQAPFVIIGDSNFYKSFQKEILESEDGILLWNFSSEIQHKIVNDLHIKCNDFAEEESKRLLYVAVTRAEDFLYVLGKKSKKETSSKCWYNFIKNNINVSKFEETHRENHPSLRIGSYKDHADTNELVAKDNIIDKDDFVIPNWFFKKIEHHDFVNKDALIQTEHTIYGESVHLLLSEMPRYKQYYDTLFDNYADDLLDKFNISDKMKEAAKIESYRILTNPKFSFLFDENSLSEVSFIDNNKEGRIDKIAITNEYLWIVDFKTGIYHELIPEAYMHQLINYKKVASKMFDVKSSNIKTAILWTEKAKFIEID